MSRHQRCDQEKETPERPGRYGKEGRQGDSQPQEGDGNSFCPGGNSALFPVIFDHWPENPVREERIVETVGTFCKTGRGNKKERGGRQQREEHSRRCKAYSHKTCSAIEGFAYLHLPGVCGSRNDDRALISCRSCPGRYLPPGTLPSPFRRSSCSGGRNTCHHRACTGSGPMPSRG